MLQQPWFKSLSDSISLQIAIQPNAKKNEFVGTHGDLLKIKIASPPVDGAANEELISFLAKTFKVRKNQIEIVRGQTSRKKTVVVPCGDSDRKFIIKFLSSLEA